MSVKIVDKRKRWDKIKGQSAELKKNPVVGVGYPESKVSNSVIAYASYNHFGVPGRIPARPFISVTIDQNKQKIFQIKEKLGAKLLAGQIDIQKALGLLGALVQGMIKKTISGPLFKETVPNDPGTIKQKGSSQPLIDTGTMRNSTTWQIFMKGKPNE